MSGGVEFVFVPSPNRATQAERSGLEHVVPPLAPLLNMERPGRRPRRLSDAEPGAAGAAGNPGARKTPRYSPGRRALSTRSVNQVNQSVGQPPRPPAAAEPARRTAVRQR